MNLQQWRLWIVGSLLLPIHARCFSGVRGQPLLAFQSPSQKVSLLQPNHPPTARILSNGTSKVTSKPRRLPSALAAASVTPIGLVNHIGILSIATLVVKGLKRIFFVSKEDEPNVGVMERCPWPFIFFHDPKQGLKDMPTWITLLYVILWRCVKAYQKCKLSG